jgi:hypothetical protein
VGLVAPQVAISQSAAISLAHALAADIAESLGMDYLVIKGIGGQLHGLQVERVPSDVDVLVRPTDFDELGRALIERGWRQRPADADTLAFPRHSASFFHPSWPCDIDVHFRFPGFEADATSVFNALWEQRDPFSVAGRWIARPGREASLIILALHYLRSIWVERHSNEYAELLAHAQSMSAEDLVAMARALGALACMRPFLVAAFGEVTSDWGTTSAEWELRTRLASPNARRVATFLRASARDKAGLVKIALFPGRETLQKGDIYRPLDGFRLALAHARRWSRGIRAIPRVSREIRQTLASDIHLPQHDVFR